MNTEWLETDLLDDAIENLEMFQFLLESDYDDNAKWKWIVIATYQALYELAICSIRGTNDFPVIESNRFFSKYRDALLRLEDMLAGSNEEDLNRVRADLDAIFTELHNNDKRNSKWQINYDDLREKARSADFAQLTEIVFTFDRRLTNAHLDYTAQGRLISIHEAIRRTQKSEFFWRDISISSSPWEKAYLLTDIPQGANIETGKHDYWKIYTHSQPLNTTPEQDRAIDRLINVFRNGFVHRRPRYWAIEVEAMIECVQTVLPIIRFLALESNNILYHTDSQRNRTENVLDRLEAWFTNMSTQTASTENEVDRRLAEQAVSYVTQHEDVADKANKEKVTAEKVTEILRGAGLLVDLPTASATPLLMSEEEREELAQRFSVGKPLSEIIIEERDR